MLNGLNDGQIAAAIAGLFLVGSKCFDVWQARYGTKTVAETSLQQQLWARIAQVENNKTQAEQTALDRESALRQEVAALERDRDVWKARCEVALANNRQLEWELFNHEIHEKHEKEEEQRAMTGKEEQ